VDGAERRLLTSPEVLLYRLERRLEHTGRFREAGADPGVTRLVGGLHDEPLVASRPRLLDEADQLVLGGQALDSHSVRTLRPVSR
jgi:hypothetical protein